MPDSNAHAVCGWRHRLINCAIAGYLFNAVLTSYFCWDLLRDDPPSQLRFHDTHAPNPPLMLRYWWSHAPGRGAAPEPTYRWSRLTAHASLEVISAPSVRPGATADEFDVLSAVDAGWPMNCIASRHWDHSVPFPRPAEVRATLRSSLLTYVPNPIGLLFNTLFYATYALICSCMIDVYHETARQAREQKQRRIARKRRRRHLLVLLAQTCRQCGYDLRGNPTAGCPECGWRHVNRPPDTASPPPARG